MKTQSVSFAAVATLMVAAAAADPGKSPPVRFEAVPGSSVKRVILTARAAERLGIETGKITEERIVRKQMVGGLVIPPLEKQTEPEPVGGFGGFGRISPESDPQAAAAGASAPATGTTWILVTLTAGEWERLAKDNPARILPLATREKSASEVLARPSGMPPREDSKRSMLRLYYLVQGNDHGLVLNKRVRVELSLSGSDEKHRVAPYAAVYYDAKGGSWVYVSKDPLVFERQRIAVVRIVGDLAVLSDGPPVGTTVVTLGAALLYGAEIFGK